MTIGPVEPSLSPSMDIQVPSNLERLLHELFDDDGAAVSETICTLRSTGAMALDSKLHARIGEHWSAGTIDDDETLEIIADVHESTGRLIDLHTAVGLGAARKNPSDRTQVVMATAHPAKFPNAVEDATGRWPDLPPNLDDLFDADERYSVVPNDLDAVVSTMTSALGATVEPARQAPEGTT